MCEASNWRLWTTPETVPLSDLGYSAGIWTGQTLEVRTTRIGWPYLDDEGRPQSEAVEIQEQFALLDEGDRLRYTKTIIDPETLTQPVTVSWDWIDIGEESLGFPCSANDRAFPVTYRNRKRGQRVYRSPSDGSPLRKTCSTHTDGAALSLAVGRRPLDSFASRPV